MRRKTLAILALVAVLAVMTAAPVSAGTDKPISGKIELTLTPGFCPSGSADPSGGLLFTWIGTVEIGGITYGWVDFSKDFYVDGNFLYFEELWTIFDLGEDGAATVDKVCNDDLVLVQGLNEGWGPAQGNTFKAEGFVVDASEDGPFAGVATGSRMMWRGKATSPPPIGPGAEFKATLHIFPLH